MLLCSHVSVLSHGESLHVTPGCAQPEALIFSFRSSWTYPLFTQKPLLVVHLNSAHGQSYFYWFTGLLCHGIFPTVVTTTCAVKAVCEPITSCWGLIGWISACLNTSHQCVLNIWVSSHLTILKTLYLKILIPPSATKQSIIELKTGPTVFEEHEE